MTKKHLTPFLATLLSLGIIAMFLLPSWRATNQADEAAFTVAKALSSARREAVSRNAASELVISAGHGGAYTISLSDVVGGKPLAEFVLPEQVSVEVLTPVSRLLTEGDAPLKIQKESVLRIVDAKTNESRYITIEAGGKIVVAAAPLLPIAPKTETAIAPAQTTKSEASAPTLDAKSDPNSSAIASLSGAAGPKQTGSARIRSVPVTVKTNPAGNFQSSVGPPEGITSGFTSTTTSSTGSSSSGNPSSTNSTSGDDGI